MLRHHDKRKITTYHTVDPIQQLTGSFCKRLPNDRSGLRLKFRNSPNCSCVDIKQFSDDLPCFWARLDARISGPDVPPPVRTIRPRIRRIRTPSVVTGFQTPANRITKVLLTFIRIPTGPPHIPHLSSRVRTISRSVRIRVDNRPLTPTPRIRLLVDPDCGLTPTGFALTTSDALTFPIGRKLTRSLAHR